MVKIANATSEMVRNNLPDDLALCILLKLPVKSLKRFGCIRKSWAVLLENPHFMTIYCKSFISSHHSMYDNTSLLLELSQGDIFSLSGDKFGNIVKLDWPNPFQEENPFFSVLDSGSISGILCLYKTNNDKVVFWNPATNEFKIIPPSPLESVPPYQQFTITLHGFGYDHVRDDYKLIRNVSYRSPNTWDLGQLGISSYDVPREDIRHDNLWEIYSLRSDTWRKVETNGNVIPMVDCTIGWRMYMDGLCHWWYFSSETNVEEKALASFDLINEVFFNTPIPLDIPPSDDFYRTLDWALHLVVLNGSLASISWFYDLPTFDILVLGEVGVKESWIKLFTIGPLSNVERPIGTGQKGYIFFRKIDGEVIWFDLSSSGITELNIKGEYSSNYSQLLIYKESLLHIGEITY